MKIETVKVYKCDFCGCCFETFDLCKSHEEAHYTINNVPLKDQYYKIGRDTPDYIVVCGYRIKNGKAELNKFKYILEGEYND